MRCLVVKITRKQAMLESLVSSLTGVLCSIVSVTCLWLVRSVFPLECVSLNPYEATTPQRRFCRNKPLTRLMYVTTTNQRLHFHTHLIKLKLLFLTTWKRSDPFLKCLLKTYSNSLWKRNAKGKDKLLLQLTLPFNVQSNFSLLIQQL